MLGCRVTSVLDRLDVGLQSSKRRVVTLLKIPDESRRLALGNIEDVVQHQDLTVDVRACADTYCRHVKSIFHGLPNLIGNALEQDDVSSGILQLLCRLDHFTSVICLATLHLESTELVNRLGLQAQVGANRNIVVREMFDDLKLAAAALELDHHRTTLLHKSHRVVERLRRVCIAHERHVSDEKCMAQASGDRLRVVHDIVNSYRYRRIVSLYDHAERIANEHDVGTGRIDQGCIARVVSRQTGYGLTVLFHFPKR